MSPRSISKSAPVARLTGLAAATVLGVTIIAAPAGAAGPPDTSLENVSNIVAPSVVRLHTQYEGLVFNRQGDDLTEGKPVKVATTCSGFVVNPNGYIATAGRCVDVEVNGEHLIDKAARRLFERPSELVPRVGSLRELKALGRDQWTVVSPRRPHRERPDRKVTAISDVIAGEAPDGGALPASVRRVRGPQNGDVALVKVQAKDLPALELAPGATLLPRTPAVSFGFQSVADRAGAALTPSFDEGSIGKATTVDGGLNQAFGLGTDISPQMTGGPTVDLEGRVLGVSRSRSGRATPATNLISPAAEIQQLLQDVGAPNDLGSASREYRTGLVAFSHGDRGRALESFGRVLKLLPGLKLAELFKSRAQKLPAPSDRGLSRWVIALLGSPLLGILAEGGRRGRRRRRQRRGAPSVTSGSRSARARRRARRRRRAGDATPALVDQDGRRFEVTAELVVGRRDADLILDDSQVSRRHAAVRPVEGGLEIEDLGSANGTSVNGTPIRGSQRLHNGDVVQVGRVRFTARVRAWERDVTVLAGDPTGAQIVVVRGSLAGRRFPVVSELVIGREDADLLLDDPQVSRRHAVVRAVDGGLEIEDLGSANGTSVNGARLDGPQRLRSGDEIAIGPVVLEPHIDREPVAATVASAA
jgi:pSer/pThr/pTyr-binding forkhead associated (FHA) protein/S1-C subfamily serine protease